MFKSLTRAGCIALFAVSAMAGCGDDNGSGQTATAESVKAAALSLQKTMNRAAQSIDEVRRTPSSVEQVGQSLQPTIATTSDVITQLSPEASGDDVSRMLLTAARQQRSFLQFAAESTRAKSRRAAESALARTKAAGRRASAAYEGITTQDTSLAGLVPAATTFNTGRLRDAVRAAQTVSGRSQTRVPSGAGDAAASNALEFSTGVDAGESYSAAVCAVDGDRLTCWTPNDGFTLILGTVGPGVRDRSQEGANKGLDPGYGTIGFGSWSRSGFRCESARGGLTCRNSEGRGWTLPRYRGLPAYF